MTDPIIERIQREVGVSNLVELLVDGLAPTDLQSLLLEVRRRGVEKLTPGELLNDYERNRFVRPASIAPQEVTRFDDVAWSHLPPKYVALELSPVAPLGAASAIATVDQNKVVSTIRNTEVVSDSSNVLALECASRRRELLSDDPRSAEAVCLAATHRILRGQAYESPDLSAHFRLLSMCAAGRDEGSFTFEVRHLVEQISFYLTLIREFSHIESVRVTLTDLDSGHEAELEQRVLSRITDEAPNVSTGLDPERADGRGYYSDACFKIFVTPSAGDEFELVDGGFTDWTRRLLSNAKERLLISGLGTERLIQA